MAAFINGVPEPWREELEARTLRRPFRFVRGRGNNGGRGGGGDSLKGSGVCFFEKGCLCSEVCLGFMSLACRAIRAFVMPNTRKVVCAKLETEKHKENKERSRQSCLLEASGSGSGHSDAAAAAAAAAAAGDCRGTMRLQ